MKKYLITVSETIATEYELEARNKLEAISLYCTNPDLLKRQKVIDRQITDVEEIK